MPEYLVELYSSNTSLDSADLEADSVEQVSEAFRQAGLEADRIVEALGVQAPALLDNRRRKR